VARLVKDYEAYDAVGLAELVRSGAASPAELLQAALARVEERDAALGALAFRFEERAFAELAARPAAGPLAGVPFLLKDLGIRMAGTPHSLGSRFFSGGEAACDSELAARYRRAGLVVFGKTRTPELGLTTTTESARWGSTRNPWRPGHSAGGSSGGAAVAVAAGIVPAAHASDGGGSIRVPASSCGLFGLKPTRGRTPPADDASDGWAGMICEHAITRSVRDSAALLDAVSGAPPGAPSWAPPPQQPFLAEVGAQPGALRIGLVLHSFNGAPVHPDCLAAAQDAAALCESLGHRVEELRIELDPERLANACGVVIAGQIARLVAARAGELGRAPREDELEPVTRALLALAARHSAADYVRALGELRELERGFERCWDGADALLSPTMAAPPPPLGVLSLSNFDFAQFRSALDASVGFTQLLNAVGVPAMSVPLFWNAQGLPIGAQFAAPLGGEALLLRLAAQLEQARPWALRRAPLAASVP
jgi:amidase